MSLDAWREGLFHLCWHQHGGSGLQLSFANALELPVNDRDWFLERIGEQRTREARELAKAARRR